ncbi:MAG: response regulator transcription factor [Flavobacteriales bacterium]|nr:MAG: response regulator transcription factor [Flavobacteriales bacterium]
MMNILIADEFPIYRFIIRSYVSRCCPKASIVDVGNMADVTKEYSINKFDLLILDAHMAGSQGLEAFVAEAVKKAKVIIFTEYEINSTKTKRLRDLGVSAFLLKSASSKEVLDSFQAIFATEEMKSA